MRFPLDRREVIRGCAAHKKAGLGCAEDDRAKIGTPVRMPFNGKIFEWFGGPKNEGGYWVGIKDKDGNRIQFAHLSARLRVPGQECKEGEIIAYTGNSGTVTSGPHLHLQIVKPNNGRIDPAKYNWGNPGGTVSQREKDYEKMYVLFQVLNLSAPPESNVNADLNHLEGIRLALINSGKSEQEADTLKWDQFFIERVKDYAGRYRDIGQRAGIL